MLVGLLKISNRKSEKILQISGRKSEEILQLQPGDVVILLRGYKNTLI